ncbi:SH3 domain-containing protein [Flavobacterium sp.]|uniref:SH3 domain-containing protein n=1 Tax=Flavobacterium sp. TaxID=239 RepID=UPI003750AD08
MEWRKYIIVVLIITSLSCNKNNNSKLKDGESIIEEINTKSVESGKKSTNEDMNKYEQILKNNGFKFPNDELYNNKIKEVFGLDIKDYAGKDFVEIKIKKQLEQESDNFPEAIVNKKFIFWYPDEGWDDLAFVNLNKYIFYNDQAAFTYLKANDGNGYLIYLVQYFGYDKDIQLLNYLFKKNKGSISTAYSYSLFFGRNGVNGKLQLRRELFEKYLKANPKVDIYQSKFIDRIIDNEKYEGKKEEDIAFLLDKMVIQCYAANNNGLFCGSVDDILLNNRYLRDDFRKNKFYNLKMLREYIEFTFEVDFLNQIRKQIKDPDGYTNLRSGKSTSSEVVEKLKTGTYIEVIDDSEDWWLVEVMEGEKIREYKKGYVHKSKVGE